MITPLHSRFLVLKWLSLMVLASGFFSAAASAICFPYPECEEGGGTPINGAAFVSQSVPLVMISGQSYPVSITMQNTGSATWTVSSFRLAAINPNNNSTWGPSQVALTSPVPNGSSYTFSFTVVAPANPSEVSQNFQWRMLKGTTNWFGSSTPNVPVLPTAANVAVGSRKLFQYDQEGQVRQTEGMSGQKFAFTRSGAGDVQTTTDGLSYSSQVVVDSLGRQAAVTAPASGTTNYTYSRLDNVASIRDARNNTTTFTMDGFGQAVAISNPDAGLSTNTYEASGLLAASTLGVNTSDAITTSFVRDDLGRPTSIASGKVRTFVYDACTSGKGQLCEVSDDNVSMWFTYTPLGQVATQRTRVTDGLILPVSPIVSFTYDVVGRLKTVTYPNGQVATYSYNPSGVSQVVLSISGVVSSVVSGVKRSANGGIGEWTFGNGLVRQAAYDLDGRIGSITTTGTAGAQNLTYSHDANNRITQITNARSAGVDQYFQYDAAGRITSFTGPTGATIALQYDAVGNRTQRVDGGVVTWNMTYSSQSNRVLSASGINSRTWSYDGRGNVTNYTGPDGVAVALTYDSFNRLATAARAGVTMKYFMDGKNQLTYKSNGTGKWTMYVYSPSGNLLAEYDAFTSSWKNYVWVEDQIAGMTKGSSRYYVHNDHLGQSEVLTDATKAVVWSAKLSAFGRTVDVNTIGGYDIGFPGQIFDALGFWHNGFRVYEPSIGRYLQADPIGAAGGVNAYAYANSNPVSNVDPLGLRSLTKCEVAILQPYFPKVNLNQISFITGFLSPVPPGYAAITYGSNIFANSAEDTPNSLGTIALLGHEVEHVRQYGQYPASVMTGAFSNSFVGDYLSEYVDNMSSNGFDHDKAYLDISFEQAARTVGERILSDLTNKGFSGKTCDCAQSK